MDKKQTLKNITFLNDETFEQFVGGDEVSVVAFLSSSHLGCRRQIPYIRKFAEDHGGRYKVGVVDVTNSPLTAQACGITSVPRLLVVRGGVVMGNQQGGLGGRCCCCHADMHDESLFGDEQEFLRRLDSYSKADMEKRRGRLTVA